MAAYIKVSAWDFLRGGCVTVSSVFSEPTKPGTLPRGASSLPAVVGDFSCTCAGKKLEEEGAGTPGLHLSHG